MCNALYLLRRRHTSDEGGLYGWALFDRRGLLRGGVSLSMLEMLRRLRGKWYVPSCRLKMMKLVVCRKGKTEKEHEQMDEVVKDAFSK
jgi:hypothetical protein